jgi:hypothetical protein
MGASINSIFSINCPCRSNMAKQPSPAFMGHGTPVVAAILIPPIGQRWVR